MTAFLAKERLRNIIRSNAITVTLVEGDWGVGKTHAWSETIEQATSESALAESGHARASLFGLDSVEEINRELLTSIAILNSSSSLTPAGQSVQKMVMRAFGRISSLTSAVSLPYISSLGNLMNAAVPLMLTGKIICIDDLERKGDDLKLVSLLGYLDRLREKYKCKVVLIANLDMFDDKEEQGIFKRYLEKTVDSVISYRPSFEEIHEIAFTGYSDPFGWVVSFCRAANIKNIRVIKRIQFALDLLLPLIGTFVDAAKENIVQSFCFCAWCIFDRENAPSIEFVQSRLGRLGKEKENLNDQQIKWESLIEKSWL